MSLFSRRTYPTAEQLVPSRAPAARGVSVSNETALRHSAVWACLRLRADLISTMPVDVYRDLRLDNRTVQVEVPKPAVLVTPGGDRVDITEWMYSTQFDLDRAGNDFGLITEVNGLGLPARIDLQPLSEVTVRVRDGEIRKYRICGKEYDPEQVWHEKQFTVAGLQIGLSPVAFAAWSIGAYLSAQEFAQDWFSADGIPVARLKNTAKTITDGEATAVKARFKAAVANHEVFVHGMDWDYDMTTVPANQAQFIEQMQYGITDVSRFFGVPADLIDAAVQSGSNIVYSSMTQRNLQLLVMNIGPSVTRRERALGRLVPGTRYVKLNSDATLLRMDPLSRAQLNKTKIDSRTLTPTEAREFDDLMPFTDEQYTEFDRLFGVPRVQPATATTGATT